jgi:pimeloyl-ACP methyl ester carboxylesterase
MSPDTLPLQTLQIDGRTLTYREAGSGDTPVVLVHGWPTSSFLWRNVLPIVGREHRALAPDLFGFGASDKPTDVTYDFEFMAGALLGFLDALELDRIVLVGHDLGGPLTVRLALDHPERLRSLVLLNTLIHMDYTTELLDDFVEALQTSGKRERFTSPETLEVIFRMGVAREESATDEAVAGVTEPFATEEARLALAKAGSELETAAMDDLAARLSGLAVPLRVIYGEQDRLLTTVGEGMARIKRELPETEVTTLPDAGHFLQEDEPERVGELIAEFAR